MKAARRTPCVAFHSGVAPSESPAADGASVAASAALARYTPCKTAADAFQLGVAPGAAPPPPPPPPAPAPAPDDGDARPCGADAARSWSDARALATDLLF